MTTPAQKCAPRVDDLLDDARHLAVLLDVIVGKVVNINQSTSPEISEVSSLLWIARDAAERMAKGGAEPFRQGARQ